jgi:hypothetical protein
LVLLRGGLTHDGAPHHDDWQTFCERIGWQSAESALPDDYEDRLAARVFGEAGEDWPSQALDEVAASEPLARRGTWAPRKARRAGAGATVAAVAAAFCAAASVTFWITARSPVGGAACPDLAVAPRAIDVPADDLAPPIDPSEAHPDPKPTTHPLRKDDDKPPPSEMKVRRPKPPGSFVAQRSHGDEARRHVFALGAPAGSFAREGRDAAQGVPSIMKASTTRLIPSAPPVAMGEEAVRPVTMGGEPPYPPGRPATGASDVFARPATFGTFDRPAEHASATWSLSPGNSRWYGASLPPSSASLGVPTGLGVIAQVDVAKAFGGL